jgi:Transmembrane secretion effector
MDSPPSSRLAPLRVASFRRLAVTYLINELGDWVGRIALAILVLDRTGSPLATAALFLAMTVVPALPAPALVAGLDRLEVRATLAVLFALEALLLGGIGLLGASVPVAVILVLAAADGTIALAGRTLTRASVAATLKPSGQLRAGNALLNMCLTTTMAAGPALAGVILGAWGVRTALLLDGLSFLIAALLVATASQLRSARGEHAGGTWLERLRTGWSYVVERPILARLVAAEAAAFVFFTITVPVDVVYARDVLGAGDAGVGILLAAWGAGAVLGGLCFIGARARSLTFLLAASTLAIAAAFLGMAAAPTLTLACLAALVGGLGNGIQWVALVSAVQELTGLDFQARVIGLLEALGAAAPGIGFVAGGLSAALLSPRFSYLLAGLGVLAVTAVSARSILRLRRPAPLAADPQPGLGTAAASSLEAT